MTNKFNKSKIIIVYNIFINKTDEDKIRNE